MNKANVLQNNTIATDEDRSLSMYITTVRDCVGHDGKVFACMASIICAWRNHADVFNLAADIAEHG